MLTELLRTRTDLLKEQQTAIEVMEVFPLHRPKDCEDCKKARENLCRANKQAVKSRTEVVKLENKLRDLRKEISDILEVKYPSEEEMENMHKEKEHQNLDRQVK